MICRCSWCRPFPEACIKHILFFTNLIYWITGMLMAAISLYVHLDKTRPLAEMLDLIVDPSLLAMTAGFLISAFATCGCVGAAKENTCLLRTYVYASVLILVLLVCLGVGLLILLHTQNDFANYTLKPVLERAVRRYSASDSDLEKLTNFVQSKIGCCGVKGYLDWHRNPYYQCSDSNVNPGRCSVPYSCCRPVQGRLFPPHTCGYDIMDREVKNMTLTDVERTIFTDGCLQKIEEILRTNALLLASLTLSVLSPLLCGIALAARLSVFVSGERNKNYLLRKEYRNKVYNKRKRSQLATKYYYRSRYGGVASAHLPHYYVQPTMYDHRRSRY